MTFVPRDEAHVICKAIVPACVEGPDTWEHSRWCNVTMEAMSRAYAAGASSRDGEVAALRGLLEQAVKYVTEDRATTPGVTRLARWTDKARAFLSARPATATGEATGAWPGHCAPPGEACAAPCARRPGHEGRHSCKPDPAPTAAPGELVKPAPREVPGSPLTLAEARGWAARIWCEPQHAKTEMDAALADTIAHQLVYAYNRGHRDGRAAPPPREDIAEAVRRAKREAFEEAKAIAEDCARLTESSSAASVWSAIDRRLRAEGETPKGTP